MVDKTIEFLEKYGEYGFKINTGGKIAYINFSPEVFGKYSIGDVVLSQDLKIIQDKITYLKEIPPDLFLLDDSKLNREGLYHYGMNIGEHLKVGVKFVQHSNGEEYETAEFDPDENEILIPAGFINENLPIREYRAAKGSLDHEAGHVLWPDRSYLYDEGSDDTDKQLIWDIGNIIDDLRIEHRMVLEFGVDPDNFRYLIEKIMKKDPDFYQNLQDDIILPFSVLCNIRYRGLKLSYALYGAPGLSELFRDEIAPAINCFIDSNDKAGDKAREILQIFETFRQR